MNFIASSTSLLRHLQSISGVLSTNNSLPILDNFYFDINDGQMVICASDIETMMSTRMEVEADENFKVCLPAKMLLDVLKSLPDQPCTFKVEPGTFALEIVYDNGKSKMGGFNGEEFPRINQLDKPSTIRVSGEVISKAINKTLFAAGNDEIRPVMSGMYCMFSPSDITFVCTDAHKLVRYRRTDAQSSTGSAFILPKKPLNLLKSNLRGDEEVLIEYSESHAHFTFGDITMNCRLVDGKYPNYEAVIPVENPNVLIIDRLQFLGAIKRVSIFSNKTTHQVRFKLAGSELNVSAEDVDFSNSADERLTCSYDGVDMEIAFNSRFLMEMLQNIDSSEIKIMMSEPSRAGLLSPNNSDNADEDILMLVMPVMLNR